MDDTEEIDEHFVSLNHFIRSHNHGLQTISIDDAKSPEAKYRARRCEQTDIDRLADSFLKFQTVHSNSIFVAFWPKNKSLPPKNRVKLSHKTTYANCKADGFFFVAGDHTQSALKDLHRRYPRNAKWSSITGTLLICHRTPTTLHTLKSWGILDNIKGQKRTAVSFANKISSIHEDYQQIRDSLGPGQKPDKTYKDLIAEVKKARMRDYDMSSNSFGQLWNLAARTGGVWGAIDKIMHGQVAKPKKFKLPRSCSSFTGMGNIPSQDLEVMLNEVVKSHITLSQFSKNCKRYKATARVQTQILTFLDEKDWEDAQERYPNTCSAQLVDMWSKHVVDSGMKQKTEMPAQFFEMLDQRLAIDKELNKSKKDRSRVRFYFFDIPNSININEIVFQVPESELKMELVMNGVTVRMFMQNVLQLATLQQEIRDHYGQSHILTTTTFY